MTIWYLVQARRHGGHSGAVTTQITACAPPKRKLRPPPSEDCAPKKGTGSVPLECSSRSGTLKILIIAPEFVSKIRLVVDSAVKTFFTTFFFSVFHSRIRETKFLCPPKLVYAPPPPPPPPSYATLALGLIWYL